MIEIAQRKKYSLSDFPISNPEKMKAAQTSPNENVSPVRFLGNQLFSSTLGRLSPTVKKVRMEWKKASVDQLLHPSTLKVPLFDN